jgi:hypothetical protein
MSGLGQTVLILVALVALQGCAALPLTMLGGAASATGAVVKTGTEATQGGTVRRTFTIPMDDVHGAILETFRRTDVAVTKDETSEKGQRIAAKLQGRTIQVRLTPLSTGLTWMQLIVKRNVLAKDRATASELLEQIEQVLAEQPTFARRLRRDRPADELSAASPRGSR